MKEWWHKKRARTRKRRKHPNDYTLFDLFWDILFWVPELFLLPLRMIFWLLRGFGRIIGDFFDIV
ncbi:hypothetical protein NC661_11500 [Aquibacillus koreensis]|uniref:Uncharacterized protein n=1 Tax=Aquibacillus koreensis TaxID=279446 RepID=A0A9X3WJS5_9BACI|nr:hypothetical protein [Aquibacillus koreensis]MCT2535136.1 hypothetical protein [Aquibacillus koreensis]MDC3420995.1 hypothetical protein [Aquibacillus koreensis]